LVKGAKANQTHTMISTIQFTWSGDNVSTVVITDKFDGIVVGDNTTFELTYDNKKNPYYHANSGGDVDFANFSKNNITKAVEKGEDEANYTYTYDKNDFPTTVTTIQEFTDSGWWGGGIYNVKRETKSTIVYKK
jgi:hypothetical protein